MKAFVTVSPKNILCKDLEKPIITDTKDVLIKVKAVGICGSDVHIYHGDLQKVKYPIIMGHEITGTVEDIGSNVSKIKIGDRVTIDQIESCGNCYACRIGRFNACSDLKVRGVYIDGGHREYIVVNEKYIHKIPDNIDLIDAVMIEPFTIAFHTVNRAKIKNDDIVFVLGAGSLGRSIIKAASLITKNIIAADISDDKLKEAINLGTKYTINTKNENLLEKVNEYTDMSGANVSIDAIGIADSLNDLIDISSNAGRIVVMGYPNELSKISMYKITYKELDIIGSRIQYGQFENVINSVESGQLNLSKMISHRFNFNDIDKAFKLFDDKNNDIKKAVLIFE